MFLQEVLNYLRSEDVRHTSLILIPAIDIIIRIRPEDITLQSNLADLQGPLDALQLLQAREVRAKTSVHADDLVVDERDQGEALEAVGEDPPKLDAVAALAWVS